MKLVVNLDDRAQTSSLWNVRGFMNPPMTHVTCRAMESNVCKWIGNTDLAILHRPKQMGLINRNSIELSKAKFGCDSIGLVFEIESSMVDTVLDAILFVG